MRKKLSNFLNQKLNLTKKELTIKEAEKLIKSFNENNKAKTSTEVKKERNQTYKSKKN